VLPKETKDPLVLKPGIEIQKQKDKLRE